MPCAYRGGARPRGRVFWEQQQGGGLGQGRVLTPHLRLQLLDADLVRPPLGALGLTTDRGMGRGAGGPPGLDLRGIAPLASAIGAEFLGMERRGLDDDGEFLGAARLG